MIRDISVEMFYEGVRHTRTIRTNVKSALAGFMRDVSYAAQELREDIALTRDDRTDQEQLLEVALDLCNGMSLQALSPLEREMVRSLNKISTKINDGS